MEYLGVSFFTKSLRTSDFIEIRRFQCRVQDKDTKSKNPEYA
jgi:hypothetical protein